MHPMPVVGGFGFERFVGAFVQWLIVSEFRSSLCLHGDNQPGQDLRMLMVFVRQEDLCRNGTLRRWKFVLVGLSSLFVVVQKSNTR